MTPKAAGADPLISCSRVSVVHGHGEAAVRALAEVDLGISEGESIGLLGPSGSGKTTLLHVLGGLVSPSQGEVNWRGEALLSLDRSARAGVPPRPIAYVFQGSNLLANLDARENIAFAILSAARREDGAARPERNGSGTPSSPEDYLTLVGLEAKAFALPADLSGGEQQRVAIARALAQRPKLLLCDEPTGHLDSDTGRRVLDLIDAAREAFGFTIVLATHDPAVAARAERTVELADGVLEERVKA
jgi:predicted ABC-type transport system involved in lysophospholipase L1 biosynthesis ATPase subunit